MCFDMDIPPTSHTFITLHACLCVPARLLCVWGGVRANVHMFLLKIILLLLIKLVYFVFCLDTFHTLFIYISTVAYGRK